MKKFICFMLMMIGMVLTSIGVTSCHDHSNDSSYFSRRDSVEIAKIAKSVVAMSNDDIEFKDPNEFLVYIVHKRDASSAEKVVFNLSDNVLSGIVNVIAKDKHKISIRAVCDEYMAHKSFYDGVSTGIPDERSTPPLTTVIVKDTTEGGPGHE